MKQLLLAGLLSFGLLSSAEAGMLSVTFDDATGDQSGPTDLISVVLTFDNTTGDYSIKATADAANPFRDTVRLNYHFYNPDAGTTVTPGMLTDNLNDITLAAPVTMLTVSGTNTNLTSWELGDRVAPDSAALGIPTDATFSVFHSGVFNFPLMSGSGSDFFPSPFDTYSVVETALVPEPSTFALLAIGGIAVIGYSCRRKRRQAA